tara:strand:- start:141 stop:815 length:675 start_codon:yes stop_codon:yes gene_type:complete
MNCVSASFLRDRSLEQSIILLNKKNIINMELSGRNYEKNIVKTIDRYSKKNYKKFKKNRGILFWITGLSGSGKTTIAEKIKSSISTKYGPTITISGDDLRQIFNFNKFSKKERLNYALSYGKFCKVVTEKNINIIFSTVSLFHKVQRWNKLNIKNYVEIYIKSDIEKIIKEKKKFFYIRKHKNIVGKNIKPEFPKYPDIIIQNNFTESLNKLSKELLKKISILY